MLPPTRSARPSPGITFVRATDNHTTHPPAIPPGEEALLWNNKSRKRAPTPTEVSTWLRTQRSLRNGDFKNRLPGSPDQAALDFYRDFDSHILFEDDDLLIVNKPAGINSHYGDVDMIGVEEIAKYCIGRDTNLAHRLDKDTSGVLVLTKNSQAQDAVKSQFRNKEQAGMKKIYVAVLDGALGKIGEQIRIEAPIVEIGKRVRVPSPAEMKDPQIAAAAKSSLTFFRPQAILTSKTGFRRTLTEVQIVTGRTHQIRVTAAQCLRHPISGDPLYNPNPMGIPRTLLHAESLTLTHPTTKESVTFKAPIPDDMQKLISSMKWEY